MTEKDVQYQKISDDNGEHYFCPSHNIPVSPIKLDNVPDACVEADVVGRYAGNIHIVEV